MASLNISPLNKGFTFIEVLIGLAIMAVIFALGLFLSFDAYKHISVRSERNIIISVLQKARAQSVDNINQARHGVHFQPGQYVIYTEGDASQDIVITPSYAVTVDGVPFDITFDQLTGNSADKTITVHEPIKSYDININTQGRIDW